MDLLQGNVAIIEDLNGTVRLTASLKAISMNNSFFIHVHQP